MNRHQLLRSYSWRGNWPLKERLRRGPSQLETSNQSEVLSPSELRTSWSQRDLIRWRRRS